MYRIIDIDHQTATATNRIEWNASQATSKQTKCNCFNSMFGRCKRDLLNKNAQLLDKKNVYLSILEKKSIHIFDMVLMVVRRNVL